MRFVGILSIISTIWHVIVTFTLVALLSAVAPTHQTASYVFTSLNVPDVGIDNHAYIFFLGLCALSPSNTDQVLLRPNQIRNTGLLLFLALPDKPCCAVSRLCAMVG